MARNPRQCIFCGANANSREHIWPTWLHDLLDEPAEDARHDRLMVEYHPKTGEVVTGPRARQGDQRTIRVRAVCARCNNGWMNQIEGRVRPALEPIVRGEAINLDADAIANLARWIALKSIVAEHASPEVALTPQSDRTAFMLEGLIPDYFRIYVAHNIGPDVLFFRRHSHCIARTTAGPNPPLEGTTKNVHVLTFVAGKAVFQTTATRVSGFALEDRTQVLGFHDRCRIWPGLRNPMCFPARPRMGQKEIRFVASTLERYLAASRTIWAELPPDQSP